MYMLIQKEPPATTPIRFQAGKEAVMKTQISSFVGLSQKERISATTRMMILNVSNTG